MGKNSTRRRKEKAKARMDYAEGKLKREDQACDMQTVIVIVLSRLH